MSDELPEVDRLRAKLMAAKEGELRMRETAINALASLVAAVDLLERGGRKAAPSDRMFDQMLRDFNKVINDARGELK